MNVRRMERRLLEVGARIKDRAYARLAALWPGPLDPEEQEEARRLFHWLVEREAEAGTPLEDILRRLPQATCGRDSPPIGRPVGRGRRLGNGRSPRPRTLNHVLQLLPLV
jgi:hypothetical protein